MITLLEYRELGYALKIVRFVLQYLKGINIFDVDLQSSDLGLSLYKKIGFKEYYKMTLWIYVK